MCLCILQVNYLFAQLSSTWDDSNVLKKSQRWCNKAAVSCIVLSEVVVSIKSSIFLRKTSDNSVPHELGAVFGAGESIITINSVYIPSIQKKELVNLYWEDFQSILRRQSPFFFFAKCNSTKVMGRGSRTTTQNLVIFFRVGKRKNSKCTAMCFQRQKEVFSENLFC